MNQSSCCNLIRTNVIGFIGGTLNALPMVGLHGFASKLMNRSSQGTTAASLLVAVAALIGSGGVAHAGSFNGTITPPTIDRWWYPFNSQSGSETSAPSFGAILQAGFDDRDAQFVLAFATEPVIASGGTQSSYIINHVRFTVYVSVNNQFSYDSSFDSVSTLYADGDPLQTLDADVGKPVELFAAGFRNGLTPLSLLENTPHSPFSPFPPREGVRNVFAGVTDLNGNVITDVSRQVRQRFEATPIAIGLDTRANPLAPGADVPEGTPLTFEVDLSQPGALAYFQNGLSIGRVVVVITSLAPAAGGPGGGGGNPRYPAFYTKENALTPILGYAAKLDISVGCPDCPADYDQDGGVTGSDISAFFSDFERGLPCADIDLDGGITGGDVGAFFINFEAGGC